MEKSPIIILCTVPDLNIAKKIAYNLIEKKLAACCNIIPGILSVYNWDNAIEEDSELLLVIKSFKKNFNSVEKAIKEIHTYDVPEIITFDISDGSNEYLTWMLSEAG